MRILAIGTPTSPHSTPPGFSPYILHAFNLLQWSLCKKAGALQPDSTIATEDNNNLEIIKIKIEQDFDTGNKNYNNLQARGGS